MKNQKFSMRLVCAFLVLALACTCGGLLPRADAAVSSLDPAKACSITVTTPVDMPEMETLDFAVDLYRFASVDLNVEYTLLDAYTGKDGIPENITEIKTYKANDLMKLAEALSAVVEDLTPDATISVSGGEGTADGLDTGLWLVVPETCDTDRTRYISVPFVVALPNLEKKPVDGATVEDWNYDITAVLKPETEELLGPAEIIKDLLSCNTSLGGADVVFSVTGDKDYQVKDPVTGEKTTETKRVYSNVVHFHFDQPGVKSYRIDDLPIGTVVTVTEVYDGGSYELKSTTPRTQVVTVDDPVEPVQVYFENEFNEEQKHSVAVLNHFDYVSKSDDGTVHYDHSNPKDSTEEAR
ncbi:MAG: hypothetical protein Q4F31_06970 [Eubacteriales bacterium]|nr:hypothetical protein [Eubacteriales bacterium]